jgi:hypothetical protein
MSDKVSRTALGHDLAGSWALYERGYVKVLQAFARAHLKVVGIRDTPAPTREATPTCLAAHPRNYSPCNGTRAAWVPPEPLVQAAAAVGDPHITVADLTSLLCEKVICPAAVGNVVVYFDASHVSATYDRTLAPYLAPILRAAMAA